MSSGFLNRQSAAGYKHHPTKNTAKSAKFAGKGLVALRQFDMNDSIIPIATQVLKDGLKAHSFKTSGFIGN
ncbi:MAG: hypothetical protein PHO08_01020 [Methylococcales bacterium]|nr:hypothetical protein [Methylococcales bacterium]MDD5632334.1 hypothetical protein [Methylococcales bacterium]